MLFSQRRTLDECRGWYCDSVIQKIKERSWKYCEGVPETLTYIDTVNVINATPVHSSRAADDGMVRSPFAIIIY